MNVTAKPAPPDRIRLPVSFDPERLREDVAALGLGRFLYYSVIPLRAPAHLIDPSRPIPPPAEDYADGSWTEWLNSAGLDASPYLREVVDTFAAHTRVTLVRVLRLEPGGVVKEHTDPTLGLEQRKSVIRLTIPVANDEGVAFYLNDEVVPMKPGECWYLRLTDPHRVVNESPSERINLTLDMAPSAGLLEFLGIDFTPPG